MQMCNVSCALSRRSAHSMHAVTGKVSELLGSAAVGNAACSDLKGSSASMVTTHGLILVACIVKGTKAEEAVENW